MTGKDSRIITGLGITAFCRFWLLFTTGLLFFILLIPGKAEAQTIHFKVSNRTIGKGEGTELSWEVKKAGRRDSITISGIEGKLGLKGSIEVFPEATTRYVLMLRYRGRTLSRSVRVNVLEPEILYFNGPDTLRTGERGILSWRTRYAGNVELIGDQSYLPELGNIAITPFTPTTYTLKACNKADQCVTAVHHVNVISEGNFVFGPDVLKSGETGELRWRFQDAKSVRIEGIDELFPAEGSYPISPTTSTTYKFVATREIGSTGREEVTVFTRTVPVIGTRFITGTISHARLPSGRKVIFDIISVDWKDFPEEIRFRVKIFDTSGYYITGMAPPEISEEESRKFFRSVIEIIEGKEYPIKDLKVREVRAMTSTPHDIVLVLDYSGSMGQNFRNLDDATKRFISRKHPYDRLGVVRFDGNIKVESELTSSIPALQRQIVFNRGRGFGGSTALYAATDAGMRLFDNHGRSLQLVVMTDGYENSSSYYKGKYSTTASEVISKARNEGIAINTIDFRGMGNSLLLEALADFSGGRYYYLRNSKEIDKVFFELQHLFHNYYEVSYKPAPVEGTRIIELIYDDGQNNLASAKAVAYVSDSLNIELVEQQGMYTKITGSTSVHQYPSIPDVTVRFDFDISALDEVALRDLRLIADYLKKNPGVRIKVTGYTDLVGSDEYCLGLSSRRAEAVATYLVAKGIDRTRITTEGKGKADPVWPVEDEPWKAHQNRRAVISYIR